MFFVEMIGYVLDVVDMNPTNINDYSIVGCKCINQLVDINIIMYMFIVEPNWLIYL